MFANVKRTIMYSLRVTPAEDEIVQQECKRSGKTTADILREALDLYFAAHAPAKPTPTGPTPTPPPKRQPQEGVRSRDGVSGSGKRKQKKD